MKWYMGLPRNKGMVCHQSKMINRVFFGMPYSQRHKGHVHQWGWTEINARSGILNSSWMSLSGAERSRSGRGSSQHLEDSQHNQLTDDTQNDSRFFFKNVSRSLAAHLVSTSSRDCRLFFINLTPAFLPPKVIQMRKLISILACAPRALERALERLESRCCCHDSVITVVWQVALLAPIWRGMWCATCGMAVVIVAWTKQEMN